MTFKDIDAVHGRSEGTARRNFNTNKKHFVEGEDYFVRNSSEAKNEFKITAPNGLVLVTESGYLMLVKSFTDDLSWDVQRQLVNSYFRAKETKRQLPKSKSDKDTNLMVKEMNARTRMSNQYLKLAAVDTLSEQYKNILVAKSAEILAGEPLLPLPKSEQKMYSASEIRDMFNVSAQKIGCIANLNGMKTDEYGEFYRDKSPYSSKEVDSFRYNDKAIDKFKELLN